MNALTRSNQFPSLIETFRMNSPLGREINDFFSQSTQAPNSVPAVNVAEHTDGFRIEVAAPGLKKEDFKLSLNHTNLTISAYQENKTEEKPNEKYTRREFSYSSFQRTFMLPNSVDVDQIRATYTDGILSIEIPKREEAKPKPPRQIEIGG
ncbi:Hsp20/alpha crystallin family protein [Rudanella lutea]|uniref:Hsp20/alpha crystallin family protein n=1 Tax=Rudanella lutea TaxID=451374 RepID=UPI00035F8715|nr:Hsp20/alpha crystallin family protein [Rudanella lutea]